MIAYNLTRPKTCCCHCVQKCMQALAQPVFVKDVAMAVNAILKVRLRLSSEVATQKILKENRSLVYLAESSDYRTPSAYVKHIILPNTPAIHPPPRTKTRQEMRTTWPVLRCFLAKRFDPRSLVVPSCSIVIFAFVGIPRVLLVIVFHFFFSRYSGVLFVQTSIRSTCHQCLVYFRT